MEDLSKYCDQLKVDLPAEFGVVFDSKRDYKILRSMINKRLEDLKVVDEEGIACTVSNDVIFRICGYIDNKNEFRPDTLSKLAKALRFDSFTSYRDYVDNRTLTPHKYDVPGSNRNSSLSTEFSKKESITERTDIKTSETNDCIVLNTRIEGPQRHCITDLDIIEDTDQLLVNDTFYFGWSGRYAELIYKGDCEFEIIDHSDKMRIGEPITARWFEKIQVKNRKGETMYEDVAGIVGESQDRLFL